MASTRWETTWVLARELLRALATPFRVLFWLPTRRSWANRAAATLQASAGEGSSTAEADLQEFFASSPAGSSGAQRPHVFLSAGESSGELHAANLMDEIAQLDCGDVRWSCFGGQRQTDRGGELLFPLSELAIMGIGGVFKALPQIVRAFHRFLRLLEDDRPDVIVLVDYPGLHLVMAEAARRRGIPVLHYVAPQYWAWGPWRMQRYKKALNATLTILPFEPAFFRSVGLPAHYVGHPLLDELQRDPPNDDDVAAVRERPTLVLLPGSRRAEIHNNLRGMLRAAALLREAQPDARVVIAHRDPRRESLLRESCEEAGATAWTEVVIGSLSPWLRGARCVLAKSGTGSLEACLHGNPTVVVYQLTGWFGQFAYRRLLTVPFVAGANLVAGGAAVPEYVFRGEEGWDRVAHALLERWNDGPARETALANLADVRDRLGQPGAGARVARILASFVSGTSDSESGRESPSSASR